MDFLVINSITDLNNALSRQRTITQRALLRLDTLVSDILPAEMTDAEAAMLTATFREAEIKLLRYYADLPTLTEFQQIPGLSGIATDEGTFGVSAIVGEQVLALIRIMEPKFIKLHRMILMLLMQELDNLTPEDADLTETILRFLRIDLEATTPSLSEKEQHTLRRGIVRPVMDAMLTVLVEYALAETPDSKGYILTVMGKRVLLHLFDSHKFIEAITKAHRRFQESTLNDLRKGTTV